VTGGGRAEATADAGPACYGSEDDVAGGGAGATPRYAGASSDEHKEGDDRVSSMASGCSAIEGCAKPA